MTNNLELLHTGEMSDPRSLEMGDGRTEGRQNFASELTLRPQGRLDRRYVPPPSPRSTVTDKAAVPSTPQELRISVKGLAEPC